MLSFRLFQTGGTNFAEIFSAKCLIHLIAFLICWHPPPRDTEITSQLRRATTYPRPCITELTATDLSLIMPSFNTNRPHITLLGLLLFFITLHFILFTVLYCIVLLYSALLFA